MSTHRFSALQELFERKPKEVIYPSDKISDFFGEMVFNKSKMRECLSNEAFDSLIGAVNKGNKIERENLILILKDLE